MKVIDLLNKIANGEEVPQEIIAGNENTYYFDKELKDYRNEKTQEKLFEDEMGDFLKYYLNDEVEIIEEEKKIPEKIEEKEIEVSMAIGEEICANKINEIIDYLKSKGE